MDGIEAFNEQVRLENDAFQKMTPVQKRVVIARDILKQLDLKIFVAKPGVYINELYLSDGRSITHVRTAGPDAQISDVLKTIASCQVCAIGALALACIRRCNDVTFRNNIVNDDYKMRLYLEEHLDFSSNVLTTIERMFERWVPDPSDGLEYATFKVNDAETRLRLICENLILNEGELSRALLEAQVVELQGMDSEKE